MKTDNVFLPHLYEPLRQKIAIQYAQQESRKLFPFLRDTVAWKEIDNSIASWRDINDKLSIRTLYNDVHGISMGFRLKSLVPWVTSANIRWSEREVTFDELWFGGRFGPVKRLNVPERASEVKKAILKPENKKILEETKNIVARESETTAPRDDFPIFVMRKFHYGNLEKTLRVIDGNRRLVQAILNGKETIRAVVGEPIAEPVLYEHWMPTQILVDLVFWHEEQSRIGRDITEETAKVIAELIRDTSAGREEFAKRSVHKEEKSHRILLEEVARLLLKDNIIMEV